MAHERPDAAALQAALAECDALRARLDAAEETIGQLRGAAQAGFQAKADFLSRMTHEMRTPLSAIIGLAKLALPLAGDEKLVNYLTTITASARGLLGVVDDITDFSRLEKGLVEPVRVAFDLDGVLERVVRMFDAQASDKGLSLAVRRDSTLPLRLVGDHERLQAILVQLVGNAVKFTEKGGVKIVVEPAGRDGETVRLSFAVSDTGIGMDPETLPAMFESFTQADGSLSRPYGGTGLGLALVERGVALLGGVLSVTSAPGQGTRFCFEVPFEADAGADAAGRAGAPAPGRAGETDGSATGAGLPLERTLILLVEDNAINQQVAQENLERFGATVDVAQNGREAVEMVQATPYDAVLMDVQMPVMDGLTATRRIRALPGGADVPIVALTAHALAEDKARCLEAGMNDYLTKPIDPDRLLASLAQWIAPAAAAVASGRLEAAPVTEAAPGKPDGEAPALDAKAALLRMGGNERLLASVAGEFSRDYAGAGLKLDAYLKSGDRGEARRLAHTIKGVAGNLAAEALATAARDLEIVLAGGSSPGFELVIAFKTALNKAVTAASRLASPATSPMACAVTGCWRILLIDDAKLNRAIFSQILRSAGHEVVTAVNGKDACRLLFGEKQTGRPFDLLLMDIEMPEMDGPAASRVIRDLLAASVRPPCSPGVPIVALTSHEPADERERCLAAGMDECLQKIFEPEELLTALAGIMNARERKARRSSCPRPASGSKNDLAPLLHCLAIHLAEGNIRVDEDVALLREALSGRTVPSELAELARSVEHYEFATARETLNRLASRLGVDASALAVQRGGGESD